MKVSLSPDIKSCVIDWALKRQLTKTFYMPPAVTVFIKPFHVERLLPCDLRSVQQSVCAVCTQWRDGQHRRRPAKPEKIR